MHTDLARKAVEKYINTGEILQVPNDLPQEFYEKKGGVFISIHKEKELRGCIGTFLPACGNLAEEIIHNAISAATRDYRFSAVAAEEIPSLKFEVSVLSKPQRIKSTSELNPKIFGVIVKNRDGRCGLLLPDLEGIYNVDQQLQIACQKGRIDFDKDDNIEIYRFQVKKYI